MTEFTVNLIFSLFSLEVAEIFTHPQSFLIAKIGFIRNRSIEISIIEFIFLVSQENDLYQYTVMK